MTGRVFFHRYPELYEFLLKELEHAVKALKSGDVAELAILHPILLLIARLYPSSLEGTDTNMQVGICFCQTTIIFIHTYIYGHISTPVNLNSCY